MKDNNFETINYIILLGKLYVYGIRGTSLQWLSSYLWNRKQYVNINDVNSDMIDVRLEVR